MVRIFVLTGEAMNDATTIRRHISGGIDLPAHKHVPAEPIDAALLAVKVMAVANVLIWGYVVVAMVRG